MAWTLQPKTARAWIDFFFIMALSAWAIIVIISYVDYRENVAYIRSDEYERGLLKWYNQDSLKNTISFSKYKDIKTDSLLNAFIDQLRNEHKAGQPGIFLFNLFRSGWYVSITILLLLTIAIFILWEFVKAPFYLRERIDAIDRKVDLIFSNILIMKNRDISEVFEDDELDE